MHHLQEFVEPIVMDPMTGVRTVTQFRSAEGVQPAVAFPIARP